MAGRANVHLTETPRPEERRHQFTGSREQVLADVAATAEAGMHELLLDLQGSASDAEELIATAAEFHAAIRVAGL